MSDYNSLIEGMEGITEQTSVMSDISSVIKWANENFVTRKEAKKGYRNIIAELLMRKPCDPSHIVCEELETLIPEIEELLVETEETVEPLKDQFVVSVGNAQGTTPILLLKASDVSLDLTDPAGISIMQLYENASSFPQNVLVTEGEDVWAITTRTEQYAEWYTLYDNLDEYEYSNDLMLIKICSVEEDVTISTQNIGNSVKITCIEGPVTITSNWGDSLQIKVGNRMWEDVDTNNSYILQNEGDAAWIRGQLTSTPTLYSPTRILITTGKASIEGNANALWNWEDLDAPLTQYCGSHFFDGSTGLVDASGLYFSANTLAESCYRNMFQSCGLITPPYLPARELAPRCYMGMFTNCPLTSVPSLPATELALCCYRYMFMGCAELTTAPQLLAETLVEDCYWGMFTNCSNLNYIKCLAVDISAQNCTNDWVNGVASSGTFVRADGTDYWPKASTRGIPVGWDVIPPFPSEDPKNLPYVAFEAMANDSYIFREVSAASWPVEYTRDPINGTWSSWGAPVINFVGKGDTVYVRGIDSGTAPGCSLAISSYGQVRIYGNVSALWNYQVLNTIPRSEQMSQLFSGSPGLIDAQDLYMPEDFQSSYGCCTQMFSGCQNLIKAPKLLAETLTPYCYAGMFRNCASLNNVTCMAKDLSALDCLSNWLYGVAEQGSIVVDWDVYPHNPNHLFPYWEQGVNVPHNWVIISSRPST